MSVILNLDLNSGQIFDRQFGGEVGVDAGCKEIWDVFYTCQLEELELTSN